MMAVVESDERLDAVIDVLAEYCQERDIVLVAAVAWVDDKGAVIVRCKGAAPKQDRAHARALVECLEGLTELKAAAERVARKDTMH